MCFGIHANDGFGVRLAKVYPLVGEIDFHAVDVGNLFVFVDFLHTLQQGKDIGGGIEIDAIFRDAVLGQTVAELRSLATQLGQMRQNERNTNQSVATGVGSGIDYTAVAFAADHGTGFFHFRHNVHLAHGSRSVVATVLFGDVAQSTRRGEVAHGIAGRVLQHIVSHGHEGVFFAEHGAVFADQCEAVGIGVDDEANVMTTFAHEVADLAEVFLEGFRIVREIAGGFAVEQRHLRNTELTEEFGDDNTSHGIHGVERHGEVGATNGINIHEFELLDHFDVTLIVAVVLDETAEIVDIGKFVSFGIGGTNDFARLSGGKEFAFFVEKFEGVPLTGVVTGGDDHAAAGAFHRYGQFCGGGGGESDVDHVETHAHQRAADDLADHLAGDARIATDYDLAAILATHDIFAQAGESSHRFCNIHGVECVPAAATDRAAESRD